MIRCQTYPSAPAVKKTIRRCFRFNVNVNTSIPKKDRIYTISVVILNKQKISITKQTFKQTLDALFFFGFSAFVSAVRSSKTSLIQHLPKKWVLIIIMLYVWFCPILYDNPTWCATDQGCCCHICVLHTVLNWESGNAEESKDSF